MEGRKKSAWIQRRAFQISIHSNIQISSIYVRFSFESPSPQAKIVVYVIR